MTQDEHVVLQTIASSIGQRGLVTPAVVLLEMVKPVSFLCSQALLLVDPVLSPLTGGVGRRCSWLLEDRRRIDGLLEALTGPRLSTLASDRKEEACTPSLRP